MYDAYNAPEELVLEPEKQLKDQFISTREGIWPTLCQTTVRPRSRYNMGEGTFSSVKQFLQWNNFKSFGLVRWVLKVGYMLKVRPDLHCHPLLSIIHHCHLCE